MGVKSLLGLATWGMRCFMLSLGVLQNDVLHVINDVIVCIVGVPRSPIKS